MLEDQRWAEKKDKGKHTLSMVDAGRADVRSTRDSALTDVSPVLSSSTAANAWKYIGGTVALPAPKIRMYIHTARMDTDQ